MAFSSTAHNKRHSGCFWMRSATAGGGTANGEDREKSTISVCSIIKTGSSSELVRRRLLLCGLDLQKIEFHRGRPAKHADGYAQARAFGLYCFHHPGKVSEWPIDYLHLLSDGEERSWPRRSEARFYPVQ